MRQYLKLTSCMLATLLAYPAIPCGSANEQLPQPAVGAAPPLPEVGAAPTLPDPPRLEPPALFDIGGDESPFSYATIGFQSCKLPCRAYLQPGLQPVIASGKANLVTHIEVPRGAARIDFADVTGSYRVAGGVLIPTGIVAASSLWAIGLACSRNPACAVTNFTIWPVLGIAAMFTGIGLLGYSAGRDRYAVRIRPIAQTASTRPRLIGVAAAPTTDGAAAGAAFAF